MKVSSLTHLLLILSGIAASFASLDAFGQEPFSRMDISLGRSFNVVESDFTETRVHRYWRPGSGGELSFLTPFYLGDAEAGAALYRFKPAMLDVPGFDALLVFAGWGYDLQVVPRLYWYNGIRLGNQRMTFDIDTFPGERTESEFLISFQTRAAGHIYRKTGIFASLQLTQAYTYIRFRTMYVSVGLTTSVSSPGWLRTLLR